MRFVLFTKHFTKGVKLSYQTETFCFYELCSFDVTNLPMICLYKGSITACAIIIDVLSDDFPLVFLGTYTGKQKQYRSLNKAHSFQFF